MARQPKTRQPKTKHKTFTCYFCKSVVEVIELVKTASSGHHVACELCAPRHRTSHAS